MLHKTTNKVNALAVILRSPALASILLIILMLYLMLAGSPAEASGITNITIPLKSIAQITITDEGKPVYVPTTSDSMLMTRPGPPRNVRLREEGNALVVEWDGESDSDLYLIFAKRQAG